jgi:hypothetical protein
MKRHIIAAALASITTFAAGAALAQMPAPADIVKAWDKNGDGAVDKAEWVAAGRNEERFALVDADKDGKVTAEELGAAMAKMRGQGGPPPSGDAKPPEGHH